MQQKHIQLVNDLFVQRFPQMVMKDAEGSSFGDLLKGVVGVQPDRNTPHTSKVTSPKVTSPKGKGAPPPKEDVKEKPGFDPIKWLQGSGQDPTRLIIPAAIMLGALAPRNGGALSRVAGGGIGGLMGYLLREYLTHPEQFGGKAKVDPDGPPETGPDNEGAVGAPPEGGAGGQGWSFPWKSVGAAGAGTGLLGWRALKNRELWGEALPVMIKGKSPLPRNWSRWLPDMEELPKKFSRSISQSKNMTPTRENVAAMTKASDFLRRGAIPWWKKLGMYMAPGPAIKRAAKKALR